MVFFIFIRRGQSLPGTTTLINDMPQSLQENVAFEQMKDILKDVSDFLSYCDDPKLFIKNAFCSMVLQLIASNELLQTKNLPTVA